MIRSMTVHFWVVSWILVLDDGIVSLAILEIESWCLSVCHGWMITASADLVLASQRIVARFHADETAHIFISLGEFMKRVFDIRVGCGWS